MIPSLVIVLQNGSAGRAEQGSAEKQNVHHIDDNDTHVGFERVHTVDDR